jgi:hypothetical protein
MRRLQAPEMRLLRAAGGYRMTDRIVMNRFKRLGMKDVSTIILSGRSIQNDAGEI